MEQFKRAKAILLPHNDINTKITKYLPNTISLNNDISAPHTNQHLYIILNDDIKDGKYAVDLQNNKIVTFTDIYRIGRNAKRFKKIIATTDTSLQITKNTSNPALYEYIQQGSVCSTYEDLLPQLSQQFIEKYIESYNKGKIITDVLVEYEIPYDSDQLNHKNGEWDKYYSIYKESNSYKTQQYSDIIEWSFNEGKKHLQLFSKLKVNPKDNTITIKFIKNSWNRKEVIKLLEEVRWQTIGNPTEFTKNFKNWIEQNL
jgi:hypothetical protein